MDLCGKALDNWAAFSSDNFRAVSMFLGRQIERRLADLGIEVGFMHHYCSVDAGTMVVNCDLGFTPRNDRLYDTKPFSVRIKIGSADWEEHFQSRTDRMFATEIVQSVVDGLLVGGMMQRGSGKTDRLVVRSVSN